MKRIYGTNLWQKEFGSNNNIQEEIWKDIVGYEGLYQVSNLGRIKSLERKVKSIHGERTVHESIKTLTKNDKGYLKVSLFKNGKSVTREVQRFVAEAFIPNPKNLPQVNHISGSKIDNRVENLEWVTGQENVWHSVNILEHAIKPVDQFDLKGNYIATYKSIKDAAQHIGIRASQISNVLNGNRNKTGGYLWKYHDGKLREGVKNNA